MAEDRKKKIVIVGVCSLILVAMVIALTIGIKENDNDDENIKEVTASQKAITTICQSTDYKPECVESLSNSANNTTDPKKLIGIAFEVSIKYIIDASQNSSVVQAVKSDPRAQDALNNCQELADRAVNDLRRSFDKFNEFNLMKFNEMLSDMKIWLSGAITYQETCLEGFEGVSGDVGAKMREALTRAMRMTSNGLAMITEVSSFLQSIGVQGSIARRLLYELQVEGHGDELPDDMGFNGRKLLSELPVMGHGEELPDWMDLYRRKLLSDLPVEGYGDELPDWMDLNGRKLMSELPVEGHGDELPDWMDLYRRKLLSDLPVEGHGDELPDWMDTNGRKLMSELPVEGHGDELPDWMDTNGRKLMSELPVEGHGDELPDWMDTNGRKLMSELPVEGHGDELPDWMDLNRRKLLSDLPVEGHGDELPDWMDYNRRKLMSELPVEGHGDELPDWMDYNGRKLLTTNIRKLEPDLIVAKDGSGQYKTINEALQHVPKNRNRTFVMYIKEGVYKEKVMINSSMTHLMILGDGPTKTKITGRLNFIDGVGTYQTATVAVAGDNFIAKDIGFENAAGPEKHQAVALRVSADKAIFYNCQMDGYQDTLYAHTYRQYYRNCVISGTIDFVFGDSAALFQNCTLVVRKPLENQQNIVTAQGRKDIRQPTGLILQNCSFIADPKYYPFRFKLPSFLGRPWKEYSRTIIMESFIDDVIHPEGWLPWNGDFALNTLFYTEFHNRGPGSNKNLRLKWQGVKELPAKRIRRFLGNEFMEGKMWIKPTKVPYDGGFIFPVPEENPNINYSHVVPEETKDLGNNKDKSSYIFHIPPPTSGSESNDNHHNAPRSEIAAPPDSYNVAAPGPASAHSPTTQPFKTQPPHVFSIFNFLRL